METAPIVMRNGLLRFIQATVPVYFGTDPHAWLRDFDTEPVAGTGVTRDTDHGLPFQG